MNIGTIDIDLRLLTQRFEDGMNRARQNVTSFSSGIGTALGTASNALAVGLAGIKTAEILATAETLQLTKQILAQSEAFNVDTNALQLWTQAAKEVGIEGDKMADIFKDVNDKIGDLANTGGGEAKDLFDGLNLNIKEFVGLKPDQAILKIGEALEKSNLTKAQKIHLLEGMADDASKLLPLIENNAKKLREFNDLTQRSGSILSDGQLDVLEEADSKVIKINSSIKGLSNVVAVANAEFINAFGDDIAEAIIVAKDTLIEFNDEVKIASEVWKDSLGQMTSDTEDFTSDSKSLFGKMLDYWRVGWTYLPQMANAGYTAAHEYGVMFNRKFQALNYQLGAFWQQTFAGIVEFAGWAFGKIADMAGVTAAFVAGRLAETLDTIGGTLSYIPGLDDMTSKIEAAKSGLRTFQSTADSAGDKVRATFSSMADGRRGVAEASRNYSKLMEAEGQAAKANAEYALGNATAKMQESEANRVLSKEMAAAERQFDSLNSKYDISAAKAAKGDASKVQLGKGALEEAKKAAEEVDKAQAKAVRKAKEVKETLDTSWLSGSVSFKEYIDKYARQFNVDANFVKAIIQAETGHLKTAAKQAAAVSGAGAIGVMQVMKATGAEVAEKLGMRQYNLKNAADNIAIGTAYLADQLKKYDGDIVKAAAAYNAGSGAVDKYNGVPPYKETQGYVKKVLAAYKELEKGGDDSGKAQIRSLLEVDKAQQKAAEDAAKRQQELNERIEEARAKASMTAEEFRKWEMIHKDNIPEAVAVSILALEEQQEKISKINDVWDNVKMKAEDAFVSTLVHGKGSWKELVDYMLEEAARLIVVKPLMNSLFGNSGGSGGGSSGGMIDSFLSMFAFADGGVMTSSGKVPLRKYAGGGIANSPQLAMFGEGSTPEAYVPVPDGAIPVKLSGNFGGDVNIQIINNGTKAEAKGEVSRTSDGIDITVILDQIDGAQARGIRSGNSATAQAMQDTFNLKRSSY